MSDEVELQKKALYDIKKKKKKRIMHALGIFLSESTLQEARKQMQIKVPPEDFQSKQILDGKLI